MIIWTICQKYLREYATKERIENWVNAAKALCMIAVLFVHSENYYGMRLGEVNPFICGFYVNAFFMISGYLLFKKQQTAPAIGADCVQYAIEGGVNL